MSDIKCIFSSHYTIGGSILTLEDDKEILNDSPVSIINIARENNIKELFLVESNFSGFFEAFENCKKYDIKLKFGLKICICDDIKQKDEASFPSESNIIIWLSGDQGYYDALKIYNKAAIDGFYYIPRIDWENLNALWTNNLALSFPFYSSFIAKNHVFTFNGAIVPNLGNISNYNFLIEEHELPFDDIIKDKVIQYSAANNVKVQKTHSCYYYKTADITEFIIRQCSANRSNWEKPELRHFSSDKFSFEEYLLK